MMHQMSKKLSGFSINYKNDVFNEYSNIIADFEPAMISVWVKKHIL